MSDSTEEWGEVSQPPLSDFDNNNNNAKKDGTLAIANNEAQASDEQVSQPFASPIVKSSAPPPTRVLGTNIFDSIARISGTPDKAVKSTSIPKASPIVPQKKKVQQELFSKFPVITK